MKITFENKEGSAKTSKLIRVSDVNKDKQFCLAGRTGVYMKLQVSSVLQNSKLLRDVLNRGDFICINFSINSLCIVDGEATVSSVCEVKNSINFNPILSFVPIEFPSLEQIREELITQERKKVELAAEQKVQQMIDASLERWAERLATALDKRFNN